MDETRFIKTVAFGGFDKTDVLNHLENLNSQVYDLKNELRDAKYLLDAYRSGSTSEKACETALAEERSILSKYQVANETLSTKLTAALEENSTCQNQIRSLKKEIEDLNAKLKSSNDMIIALQAGTEAAALGNVFIEAQKASDMLVGEAKSKSAQINYDAKKAAEDTISGANKLAEEIVREAEHNAAETIAEAERKAEELTLASNSVRTAVTKNADILAKGIGTLKYLLDDLNRTSSSALGQSEKLLGEMSAALRDERVVNGDEDAIDDDDQITDTHEEELQAPKNDPEPVHEKTEVPAPQNAAPEHKEAEPAQQENAAPEHEAAEGEQHDQEKNGGEQSAKPVSVKHVQGDNQQKNKKGKIDLAALAAQANAISKKK